MSLTEHRWSPSTVKFTYSPQPRPPLTIPTVSTIIDFINSIFQSSIVLIVVQWSAIHFESNRIFGPILRYLRHLLPYNDIRILDTGGKAFHITPYGGLCIVCLAMFLFFSKSMPMEESFLIIRSLGVQVTTQMRFPLACHSRFIPASEIDDVFLYEGFKRWEVRYYLAIVVRGEEKVEVVFPKLLPRRVVLEQVWRTAKEVLFSVDDEATTTEVTS